MTWKTKALALAACVLAVAAIPAAASAANQPDSRLDAAASYVAGRSVSVWCESSAADWIHAGDAHSEDWSGVAGFSYPLAGPPYDSWVFISPEQCHTLQLLLANPGTGDVGPAEASLAVHTLVHEATHLALHSGDEHLVDCTALTHDADVATRFFGIPQTDQQVRYLPVRRNGHTVAMRRVVQSVPSAYLARFNTWDQAWHNNAPAPYSGAC
jgi:hypothetical protein